MTGTQLLGSIIFDDEPVAGQRYRLTNAMSGRETTAVLVSVEPRTLSFGSPGGKRITRQARIASAAGDGAAFEREIVPPLERS